jgi:dihydrodipicolinate synthase/N-acetylneuraminate lyase
VKGIWPALYTPLDESGALLHDAFAAQIQFLCKAGVNGVVLCGTTGEFPYLSLRQRRDIVSFVRSEFPDLPIVVHISDFAWKHIDVLIREAEPFSPSAFMLLPPLYFSASQDDILAHYEYFAGITHIPFLVYDFPGMTHQTISAQTLKKVFETGRFCGIKQSAASVHSHKDFLPIVQQMGCSFLSGVDLQYGQGLEMGVDGLIGGLAHPIPEWFVACSLAYEKNDRPAFEKWSSKIFLLSSLAKKIEFPLNVAAFLKARGFEIGAHKKIVSSVTKNRFELLVAEIRVFLANEGLL